MFGDQPPAPDHDQMLGGLGHLAHQMRGQEHRAPFGGETLEQVTDPVDALRIQAVGRLVEDHRRGIAQQRRGDTQTLAHPEREAADPLARDLTQADQLDHLIHTAARDPVSLGQREQMVIGRAPGVDRVGLEHRADLVQRRLELAVAQPLTRTVPLVGASNPESTHRRRLTRPVGTEETVTIPGLTAKLRSSTASFSP